MKTGRNRDAERGSILIVFPIVAGLMILLSAMVAAAFAEFRAAQRSSTQTQAFYMAEAGLDNTLVQLRTDHDYTGTQYVPLYDSEGNTIGGYEVTVEDIGSNQREVTAVGYYPNNNSNSAWYSSNTVIGTVTVPNPPFIEAVFAQQSLQLTGNGVVDSYNSSDNSYNADLANSNGDVGTNGTSAGVVNMTGNLTVKGNAWAGPDADVDTAITITDGNVTLEGDKLTLDAERILDPVEIPEGLTCSGDLTAQDGTTEEEEVTVVKGKKTVVTKSKSSGSTVTLGGGTYYYHDVQITGQSQINCTGPVTIYADGDVSIGGNGIATSGDLPPNLLIYVAGSGTVHFTGNGAFYGAVYAPESSVLVSGNGETYGALVGNTVQISGNGGMHYDEALNTIGDESTVRFNLWTQPD